MLAAGVTAGKVSAHDHGGGSSSPLFEKTGNFDLTNPVDLLLARTKAVTCLAGNRTHTYMMSRHMLAEPGKEVIQLLAELELMTIWLTPSPDGAANKAVIKALFTRIPVDPFSFEPIDSYYNPRLGREIELRHTMFGGSGTALDPSDPKPNLIMQQDEPHYMMGDKIGFVMFDPRLGEGPFQPHIDSAIFLVDRDGLMDPSTSSVEADYSFTATLKASVYSWSKIPAEDDTRMVSLKVGRKVVGGAASLPPEFRSSIAALYPERL